MSLPLTLNFRAAAGEKNFVVIALQPIPGSLPLNYVVDLQRVAPGAEALKAKLPCLSALELGRVLSICPIALKVDARLGNRNDTISLSVFPLFFPFFLPVVAPATIDLGPGDDFGEGSFFKDTIIGGDGKDRIKGRGGADTLSGGNGDDTIKGNTGKDKISGGPGDDVIEGGTGQDTIDCGSGNDTADASSNDTVSGNCERVI